MTDDHDIEDERGGARPGRPSARRAPQRAAAEYALLGLIAQTEAGEIHGYDLARAFSESSLGKIIRLESGMLYHYLKKLAKDEYIRSRIERQSGRPDRQVHTLTPEGNAALRDWIGAPVGATREIRLEFLIKLYLARNIDPAHAAALVSEQRSVMRSRTERLAKQLSDPQPDDADTTFGESVLRLRLTQTQAALDWLDTLPESRD